MLAAHGRGKSRHGASLDPRVFWLAEEEARGCFGAAPTWLFRLSSPPFQRDTPVGVDAYRTYLHLPRLYRFYLPWCECLLIALGRSSSVLIILSSQHAAISP